MGISSGVGLMSGLDTEAIIQATMNAEKTPILLLQHKQATFNAKISSYGSLKSSLNSLQTAVTALKDTDNFAPSYNASSSNEDLATVTSSSDATGGTYSMVVSQLATSSQMTSHSFTESTSTVGTGMLHFQLGDGEKYSIEIDSENNSLSDIVSRINDADTDVSASVLKVNDSDYRLTLTSKSTGKDIDFTYQEEGLTFTTTTQASDSAGETMTSEGFTSDSTALSLTGTLSVNGTDITLTGTETLNDIQASINAIAGTTATVELNTTTNEYELKVSSDTADTAVNLTFSDTDTTGGFSELIDPAETQTAQLAMININGIDVTRTDNSIDDLITGVTIDLVDADPTKTFNIGVTANYSTTETKVSDFVSAYNEAISTIEGLQSYNADTNSSGELLGDSTTNRLKSGLRRLLFSSVDGVDSSVNSLSSLGVTLQESGQLEFNLTAFNEGITENKTDVINFFTQKTTSNEGFAVQFDSFLDSYLDNTDGILKIKEDGYQNSIKRMDNTIESIERRLTTKEASLRSQYLNLEELMATFNSTSTYLSSQLSAISNMSKSFY